MPKRTDIHKILIIGSGPIVIGQACEFDYSGTQACKALRSLGYEIVLVNSNPATIMTDPGTADTTYIEPLNVERLTQIIEKERPDALLPNLGGQSGLNLCKKLTAAGVLEKYGVKTIGVDIYAIERGEDRIIFKEEMEKLGVDMARSAPAYSVEEALEIARDLGYPVVIRPAYTMGGAGGGFAHNDEELSAIVSRGISASLVGQVLVEESILGWEELEVEVVRDQKGKMVAVAFIENIDPLGVHTGDSFCAAPMITVSNDVKERLQDQAFRIVESIGVIGGTNVQFAYDPKADRIVVIEINPRTSRSSALASKATGFPIALVSAMLATGITLDEIPYWRDGTLDKYTMSGDYVVIKFARWAFDKFASSQDKLGTQMRAVGEVMSIGKTYKEAFQKAIRSLERNRHGLGGIKVYEEKSLVELLDMLKWPTSERHFIMYEAFRKGASIEQLRELTHIKEYFLVQMKELVDLELELESHALQTLPDELLVKAKKDGFSDRRIADLLGCGERDIAQKRAVLGVVHGWDSIPVSAVDNASYYYSTYNQDDKSPGPSTNPKVMILGMGPNRIGQGIEFDYCCVHAALKLREMGYETIIVNCNPSTVSTDYDTSDKLYFEPLTVEDVMAIYEKEKPIGVIAQFGGQTPLNLAAQLEELGVRILGTSPKTIGLAEDRDHFRAMMEKLGIPAPTAASVTSLKQAKSAAREIGYPLMVRPSYVLGGAGMRVVQNDDELVQYMDNALSQRIDVSHPVLLDRFLANATEAEADAVSDGKNAFVPAVMEHIELAGIHSGDSACVIPSVGISQKNLEEIKEYTQRIAVEMGVKGLMNIQYAIMDNTVYILEANPRASRTVPLVSKVCNFQMVRVAVEIIMNDYEGKSFDLSSLKESKLNFFGVKEAVFPFGSFPEVDPFLGPEMYSTGEVLGIADTFGSAFARAQESAALKLPTEGTIFISVPDQDKAAALEVAKQFVSLGFDIFSTSGTAKYFEQNGIKAIVMKKMHEGSNEILEAIASRKICAVVNTPKQTKDVTADSGYIRKEAIRHVTPYYTTIAAAKAAVNGIREIKKGAGIQTVKSIQEYHEEIRT